MKVPCEIVQIKLDLGCGISKEAGFIGVDNLKFDSVDVLHDLNDFPYPFADNFVDEILMNQVLEHLREPLCVMEELHRICKHEARVTVCVPYFRSHYAIIDPTHRSFFGIHWFDYLDPSHEFFKKYRYTNASFRIEKREFDRDFFRDPASKRLSEIIRRTLIRFANLYPDLYERKISHFYPLDSLTFHLKVDKV